ncbi:Dolichyl-diphosphooligosaccharide--protein glycosyltransferase subunit 1B [Porphyridium purpureum]|uniref:Dolichyl-diphosphooligosaccharide--protein glycosyltransferase subunit 1 n=1 Tax=Porphyridium purpureum TaxID=35688 RepID=A0A5J4YHJ2_PORPP|nr:Dolichyl-diphosphooligosaccharide--protein glycosyltransferase subunit 1B [Porphyridium purpureum]|eukprot:POR8586..scf270_19
MPAPQSRARARRRIHESAMAVLACCIIAAAVAGLAVASAPDVRRDGAASDAAAGVNLARNLHCMQVKRNILAMAPVVRSVERYLMVRSDDDRDDHARDQYVPFHVLVPPSHAHASAQGRPDTAQVLDVMVAILDAAEADAAKSLDLERIALSRLHVAQLNDNTYEAQIPREAFERAADHAITVVVILGYLGSGVIIPVPQQVESMRDKHAARVTLNAYVHEPYGCAQQISTFEIVRARGDTSSGVISGPDTHAPGPLSVADDSITFGPYRNLQPRQSAFTQVTVRYPAAWLEVEAFAKTVRPSLWGSIRMHEDLTVAVSGSLVKSGFSRAELLTGRASFENMAKIITVELPPRASALTYKDRIGNITTSSLAGRKRSGHQHWELELRFPLIGHSRNTFFIHYDVPSQAMMFRSAQNGRYMMRVRPAPSAHPMRLLVRQMELRIELPVGASHIQLHHAPEYLDAGSITMEYADTQGFLAFATRPVLVVRSSRSMVADEFSAVDEIEIEFSLPPGAMLRGPLTLCVTLFALFGGMVVTYQYVSETLRVHPQDAMDEWADIRRTAFKKVLAMDRTTLETCADVLSLVQALQSTSTPSSAGRGDGDPAARAIAAERLIAAERFSRMEKALAELTTSAAQLVRAATKQCPALPSMSEHELASFCATELAPIDIMIKHVAAFRATASSSLKPAAVSAASAGALVDELRAGQARIVACFDALLNAC